MKKRKPSGAGAGRADILAAALKEFADNGFRGASTPNIARRAKVTQPLVYHHFASKQALWDEVVDGLFGGLLQTLTEAMQELASEDRRTRLEHLLRSFIRYTGKHPELARLIRAESNAGGAPYDTLYSRWISRLVDLYRREVAAGVKDGTLRAVDPRFAYFAIVGAVSHPFSERKTAERAFALDFSDESTVNAYSEFVIDLVMEGLGKTPRPRAGSSKR